MKNILIICNTYSQLIIAIRIKNTLKAKDNVTVIITDQSNNANQIYENLLKVQCFEEVYYVETKDFCKKQKSRVKALKDTYHAVFGYKHLFGFLPKDKVYDEIIFYNPDIATHCLFAMLNKRNEGIIVSRYEEGLISYDSSKFPIYKKLDYIYRIRTLLRKRNLQLTVQKFYCFYPAFYQGNEEVIQIPGIEYADINYKNLVSKVFNVNSSSIKYPYKYIYFSSIFDFEGMEPVDELGICRKISEYVGKNNLLVKVHPRDNAERFKREGLNVDELSTVPWEVIQLNYDFSNHVFLTLVSTSVITISSIIDNPPKIFFLYKTVKDCKNEVLQSAINSFENIDRLGLREIIPNLTVVDKIEKLN